MSQRMIVVLVVLVIGYLAGVKFPGLAQKAGLA